MYISFMMFFENKNHKNKYSLFETIGLFLFFFLLLLSAGWFATIGLINSLVIFGGTVTPSVHGYTVAILGYSTSMLCIVMLYKILQLKK